MKLLTYIGIFICLFFLSRITHHLRIGLGKFYYYLNGWNLTITVLILSGILLGILFWKRKINVLLIFLGSFIYCIGSFLNKIYRFYEIKATNTLANSDIFLKENPCFDESNYETFHNYVLNGCHYSYSDIFSGLVDSFLILSISTLITRLFLTSIEAYKKNKPRRKLDDILD